MFDKREMQEGTREKAELQRALGRWCLIRESCRKVPERKPNLAYLGTLVFDQRELQEGTREKAEFQRTLGRWCLIRESCRKVSLGETKREA